MKAKMDRKNRPGYEDELREMEEVERELASVPLEDLPEAPPEEAEKIERDLRAFADSYLKKKKLIGVRIPMEVYIELERRARSKGLSPSAVLRLLINEYIKGKIKVSV